MKKNNNTEENKQDIILSKLQQVYELISQKGVEEIVANIDNVSLKIKRFAPQKEEKNVVLTNFTPSVGSSIGQKDVSVQQELPTGEEIVSPINGVFYRSPAPGAPPFVNEGDIVQPGSVLCLVEAMKIMNEIKATKKCKILKILCENGSSVSVGTKLFIVEPL